MVNQRCLEDARYSTLPNTKKAAVVSYAVMDAMVRTQVLHQEWQVESKVETGFKSPALQILGKFFNVPIII
jgi:hypothetical protein